MQTVILDSWILLLEVLKLIAMNLLISLVINSFLALIVAIIAMAGFFLNLCWTWQHNYFRDL